jgi:glycosyltransferase involved in cell wall biosynthesis
VRAWRPTLNSDDLDPAKPDSKSLRLLVVVPFGPRHDNRHGGRVVAQLLSHLVDRHEVAIVYLDRADDPPIDPELAARCAIVKAVPFRAGRWVGPRWHHRLRVLSSQLTGSPSPVGAVHSRRLARTVQQLASQWRPDVIQIEHDVLGYCLPYVEHSGAATVLVSHDPGLRSSHDLIEVTGGRQRVAHRLDVRAWRRYWAKNLVGAGAVVVFTRNDAKTLAAAVPGVRLVQIPLGIDLPARPSDPAGSEASTVMFIGGYAHDPNLDAAIRLMRSIMPRIREREPEVRLMLVGDDPSPAMRDAAGAGDEITGGVPSVAPYLDRAAVIALPIRLGGGMRVKLLEAMAAGKAVVASPVAVAGLEAVDHDVLRIAETDTEFSDAILELLADRDARVDLGQNARSWAVANLSWDARRADYEQLYRTLLAAVATARTETITR